MKGKEKDEIHKPNAGINQIWIPFKPMLPFTS